MKSQINALFFIIFAVVRFIPVEAQVYNTSYANIVGQCSQANILANLTAFENFGIKYRGTAAQANTLQWLKNQYLGYGYTASQIVESPFTYNNTLCKNLIVTKTGSVYPNIFLIIDAHYDTIDGPGTNDNGSGVAVMLEIARLLQNVQTEYSIKFINFSGEEDGLRGSQHYVNTVVNGTTPKMDIRLVINIDQVGGVAGEVNNTITCERDTAAPNSNNATSSAMTNQLRNCYNLYSPLQTNLSFAYGSDYVPFQNNGEIITGLYEFNESSTPHTPNDKLVNMDPVFVYNVAKGAIGAALHFAIACSNCNLGIGDVSDYQFRVYPNPAADVIYIEKGDLQSYSYAIMNVLGKTVVFDNLPNPASSEAIRVDGLAHGIYFMRVNSGDRHFIAKIIIE